MTGGRGGDISGDKNDKRATQTCDLWWYLVCMEKGERVKRAVKATLIEDIKKERKKKERKSGKFYIEERVKSSVLAKAFMTFHFTVYQITRRTSKEEWVKNLFQKAKTHQAHG